MTRGTFYFIDNDSTVSSTEFNGDMYDDGHGDIVLSALRHDVTTKEDFIRFVEEFNVINFQYDDDRLTFQNKNDIIFDNENKTLIDFSNDYFGRFFSDYIFIKNISDRDITIIDKDSREEFVIKSGNTDRFNFGTINESTFKYDSSFILENRRKYLV